MSFLDERKFSVPQAAEALGVCNQVIYELIQDGQITAYRIRKKLVIPEGELLRFSEAAKHTPPPKRTKRDVVKKFRRQQKNACPKSKRGIQTIHRHPTARSIA